MFPGTSFLKFWRFILLSIIYAIYYQQNRRDSISIDLLVILDPASKIGVHPLLRHISPLSSALFRRSSYMKFEKKNLRHRCD